MRSEFDLRFTLAELTLLDKALGAMPYREVAALFAKINAQISAQTAQEPVKTDEPGR